MRALHPAFVSRFDTAPEDEKSNMISALCRDWLEAACHPLPVDHAAALQELLQGASTSAYRAHLIENVVCKRLVEALCQSPTSEVGAKALSAFLSFHPNSSKVLIERFAKVLMEASPLMPALHHGLERLAATSQNARKSIFPSLLTKVQSDLLSNEIKDFDGVRQAFQNIERLRSCLDASPYHAALATAFSTD